MYMTNRWVEIYSSRVQRLIDLLDQKDPQWFKRRTLFSEVIEFELGKNFFVSFFLENEKLHDTVNDIMIRWFDGLRKQFDADFEEEEREAEAVMSKQFLLGTMIEEEFKEDAKHQQKCLDFAWWLAVSEKSPPLDKFQKGLFERRRQALWTSLKD